MKGPFIAFSITLLNITWGFLPQPDLLLVMGIAMTLDFVTGLIKAVFNGTKRTSAGYRKTVTKFAQYGISIIVAMGISYLAQRNHAGEAGWEHLAKYSEWFNNGLLVFIIFIEVTSILENLYAMNPKSKFAQYAIKPALRILTIELKKNPLTKVTIVTEDPEIDPDKIKILEQ